MAAFWTILAILVRMCRNGNKTISDVQFDPILSFSVPDFLYDETFWKLGHNFSYFSQFSAANFQLEF